VEHRWGQRKATHQRVRIVTAGGVSAQGYIANVSLSGAFVTTLLSPPVLSIVQIAFGADQRRSRISGTVAAQVVRKTPEGLGLEWWQHVSKIVDSLVTSPAAGDSLHLTSPVPHPSDS
jgi:hypothetical protein